MMTRLLVVVVLVVVPALNALGEEEPADSQISSVAMFKNGLVVVKRTVEVPGPGTYLVSDVPVPVHGTFWIGNDSRDPGTRVVSLGGWPARSATIGC
jgi:hypothetical protein